MKKLLHLYWSGGPLSWLRAQTVFTFLRLNPKWKVIIWEPLDEGAKPTWTTGEQQGQYLGEDWLPELKRLRNVETRSIELPKIPEVLRSDFLRWHALSSIGGWWSDFDIVYIRPMSALPNMGKAPGFVQYKSIKGDMVCPVGFLGADTESARVFFNTALWAASALLEDGGELGYQSLGRHILEEVVQQYNEKPTLPTATVYPFHTIRKSIRYFERGHYNFPEETIGLHWYAGAREFRKWENELTQVRSEKLHSNMLIIMAINDQLGAW
jgi:hypothetical protein